MPKKNNPGCPCCASCLNAVSAQSSDPAAMGLDVSYASHWHWGTVLGYAGNIFPSGNPGGDIYSADDTYVYRRSKYVPSSDYITLSVKTYQMLPGDIFYSGLASADRQTKVYVETSLSGNTVSWSVYLVVSGGAPSLIGGPVTLTLDVTTEGYYDTDADYHCSQVVIVYDQAAAQWYFGFAHGTPGDVGTSESYRWRATDLTIAATHTLRVPIVGVTSLEERVGEDKYLAFDIILYPCACGEEGPYQQTGWQHRKLPRYMTLEVSDVATVNPYTVGDYYDLSLINKTHTMSRLSEVVIGPPRTSSCNLVNPCLLYVYNTNWTIGATSGDGMYAVLASGGYDPEADETTITLTLVASGSRITDYKFGQCTAFFSKTLAGDVDMRTLSALELDFVSQSCLNMGPEWISIADLSGATCVLTSVP